MFVGSVSREFRPNLRGSRFTESLLKCRLSLRNRDKYPVPYLSEELETVGAFPQ
jgi:hypothetical protein